MNKPGLNEELELEVNNLAFGGKGVARQQGYVIFVEGAVPGDVVRAVITKSKASWAEARTLEILNPSRARIAPACRHFGVCGGCSWQTLTYEKQLQYKQSQVVECLEHIGGQSGFEIDAPIGADPLWRYRNKVEFSFAENESGLVLGFHLPGQWRSVMDVEDCLLHSKITNGIRNHVRGFARASGAGVHDQDSGKGFWRHLVIREGKNTGEVMVNIVTGQGDFPDAERLASGLAADFPQIKSLVWSVNATRASVAGGFPYTVLAGRDHIFEELCGLRLQVSPSSFLQTNTLMAERLYRKALSYAEPRGDEHVLDLYSGIGSIALFFAQSCREVMGVEIVEDAVRLADINAYANRIGNATFLAGRVRSVLKDLRPEAAPDLIVLDPPRAGASKKEIQRILELEAPRLVYVSCNASTMAGNAAQLAEGGYRLLRIGAVDMFPHTPHIEVVARFELQRPA
ncbi:MAG: 23S rRNA (uracil(1939)-C(5))-methyltransferase RlmD [Thermoleophilia bacterium]